MIRHPSHDTAGQGAWFVTINTRESVELFGRVMDGQVELNALGVVVRDAWQDLPLHFAHIVPDSRVVMPNHFHGNFNLAGYDIRLTSRCARVERSGAPVFGSIATVVRSLKSGVTRAIREIVGEPILVWQKRFYDRRLWHKQRLESARKYIRDHPIRWCEGYSQR